TDEHFAASHLKAPVAHVPGSDEQPSALIAYTRLLPKPSRPLRPSTPRDAVLTLDALIAPSLPRPEMYSSLVPTTIDGGLPGPSRLASTGEVAKPTSVRWRVPLRSASHAGLPDVGAPE